MRELTKPSVMNTGARALTTAILTGAIIFAIAPPAWAQKAKSEEVVAAPAKSVRQNPVDQVEKRIISLHGKLHITSDQEPAWNTVAQAMRDNAKAMKALLDKRSKQIKNINAVNELRSHAEMAELHAAGYGKLIPAFEALYNAMPEDQKKIADEVMNYREKPRKHGRK